MHFPKNFRNKGLVSMDRSELVSQVVPGRQRMEHAENI